MQSSQMCPSRLSVAAMQESLYYSRGDVRFNPLHTDSIQSVAGFASLHVGIILTLALVTHFTVRHTWIRRGTWVYFGLTVVSTLYFGWHYIADDVGGAVIAILAVWLGGLATGQRFLRRGRSVVLASRATLAPVDTPDTSHAAEWTAEFRAAEAAPPGRPHWRGNGTLRGP